MNFSKSCHPPKLTPRACRTVKVSDHDSIRKTRQKWHRWETPGAKTTSEQKGHKDSSHICQQKTQLPFPDPWDFCGMMRQKLNFLSPIKPAVKLTQHLIKRTLNSQTWWWQYEQLFCFRSWKTCSDWWSHEFYSLPERPAGECLVIRSCPEAQGGLGLCSRTIIENTPASTQLNG